MAFDKIRFIHFGSLLILICGFAVNIFIGLGLHSGLAVGIKCVLYLSGIILFFTNAMPFKKIAIYYLFYVMTPVVLVLFHFVHGIFFGVLSSLFLAPIMPVKPDYAKDDLKVYAKFKGFLGPCCEYYVTQEKLFLFEEFKGAVRIEGGVDFDDDNVVLTKDSIVVYADEVHRLKLN